jgi:hypothetical protein
MLLRYFPCGKLPEEPANLLIWCGHEKIARKATRLLLPPLNYIAEVEKEQVPAEPFDILKRHLDGGFIWLEASSDLRTAKVRLVELHSKTPGDYFVFDQRSQQIVANCKGVTRNEV